MDVYSSEQKIVSSELLENVIKILEDKELVYSGTLPAPKGVNSENWESVNSFFLDQQVMVMILIEL